MPQDAEARLQPRAGAPGTRKTPAHAGPDPFPVREYVGAMAAELAQMARWDGDEALAQLLETAAGHAAQPPASAQAHSAPATSRQPS